LDSRKWYGEWCSWVWYVYINAKGLKYIAKKRGGVVERNDERELIGEKLCDDKGNADDGSEGCSSA